MTTPFRTNKTRPAYLDPVHEEKESPRFEPVPTPQPVNTVLPLSACLTPAQIAEIQAQQQIVFHVVGDTGGVHGTDIQEAIAVAMEAQCVDHVPTSSAFFYHLGDVVYYNGRSIDYTPQFYEPYKFYPRPIFAIAGNHDGDTKIRPNDPPDMEPSLFGFFQNFCASHRTPISTYRDAMTQPYVFWRLDAPFVTMIGLYGNIDGMLDGSGTVPQEQWLTGQLRKVDPATCLIIAVHQPPYSLDMSHAGYPRILEALDRASQATGVVPHAVLSGHVHNYQRFTRHVTRTDGRVCDVPYLIAGAGGYARTPRALHKMNRDISDPARSPVPCPVQTTRPDVELRAYNEVAPGFLRVTVDTTHLTMDYFTVPFAGSPPAEPFDSVSLNHRLGTIDTQMNPGLGGAE